VIEITEAARIRFKQLLSDHPGKIIRIEISSGGCNGFKKDIRIDDPAEDDINIPIGDRILSMDPITNDLLSSSTVDWINDLAGSHFDIKISDATSSCGCGESFSL
jgi:iron-sulfur cluster insertion protein